jgi:hypothetical protein
MGCDHWIKQTKRTGNFVFILFVLGSCISTANGNGAIVAEGQLRMENRLLHSGETVPFVAYISSNRWKFMLRVSKSEINNAYDLTDLFDGTNRIHYFQMDTNADVSAQGKRESPDYHAPPRYEAMIFPGGNLREGALYQNILWFALDSAGFFKSSNTNTVVMQSLFPGVGIGDYLFDITDRYICSVSEFLPGSGLPQRADFLASKKLWKDEGAGKSDVKWPFQDGYKHARYEVISTQTLGGQTFPAEFALHIFWPRDLVGLSQPDDEVYFFHGIISSLQKLDADNGLFILTNAESTAIRDYRRSGPPATYILRSFDGPPDINDPRVKQAFANAQKIAPMHLPIQPPRSTMIGRVVLFCFLVIPVIVFCRRWLTRHQP